jgi:RimJ/RimL family protein N-acetyltransferase
VIDARGRRPPVLTTARLLLRELRTSDAPAVAAHAGDERVARYLIEVPSPYPVALARRWIHGRSAWWELGRGVTLAVVRRDAPDVLLGTVSLRRYARDRRAELGYWLAASAWGRGYATEAVAAMIELGFRQLALARIYAQVFAGNDASMRVLEKLGMVHEGTKRRHLRKGDRLHDVKFYGLLREEWSPP